MKIIARIYNGFESKFGVPRQSLICPEIKSRIVFEKEYRNPDATGGFTDDVKFEKLRIEAEDGVIIPSEIRGDIEAILSEDPRPQYHHDDERVYGISYSGYNIKFRVKDKILTIVSIESIGEL